MECMAGPGTNLYYSKQKGQPWDCARLAASIMLDAEGTYSKKTKHCKLAARDQDKAVMSFSTSSCDQPPTMLPKADWLSMKKQQELPS